MKPLTYQRLKQLLRYNKRTGVFTRLTDQAANALKGSKAGWKDRLGYIMITLDGERFQASRLAWFYVTKKWPAFEIDHKNGKVDDNRFCNLRDISHTANLQNRHKAAKHNQQGLLGVRKAETAGKFRAQIKLPEGKRKWLGTFNTAEDAHQAYLKAKRQFHKGCTL